MKVNQQLTLKIESEHGDKEFKGTWKEIKKEIYAVATDVQVTLPHNTPCLYSDKKELDFVLTKTTTGELLNHEELQQLLEK
ncbi:hypothetical protein U8V72_21445 [Priestia filamentosa]|uniref:hypothetical protein n=1 Tax=Priestia filamentosa TaxID=1402861 RepID=UPI00058967F2